MSTSQLKPDYNFKYFLLLMQMALNATPVPEAEKQVNWQAIYDIAVEHSLGGMLYYAIERLPEKIKPRGEFMPYLRQMYQEQIVADINLSVETEKMLDALSSKGVRCLPVKGINTKFDYPESYLRTMTDVDILCDIESRLAVEKIFLENGYTKENVGEKDTSYRKEEILHFEVHHSLLKDVSPAFDYFSKIWDRVNFKENSNIAYMTLEDTYIFMLEHLASHIEFGGAGIRMYMDVYLFLKKHGAELDRSYTDKVLADILLSDFEKKTLGICKNWFSGEEEVDYTSKNAVFILYSCTFGRSCVSFLSDSLRNDKNHPSATANGIRRILKKLFPSLNWMRLSFKAVDKVPLLYPLFVPVHWASRLFIKRNVKTANIGKYFVTADSKEAKELEAVFTSLGLEKRI